MAVASQLLVLLMWRWLVSSLQAGLQRDAPIHMGGLVQSTVMGVAKEFHKAEQITLAGFFQEFQLCTWFPTLE